jgi:DNA-binding CsgD family transcriptional regulator
MPVFSSQNLVLDPFLAEYPLLFFLAWTVFFLAFSLSHFLLYGLRELVVPLHTHRRLLVCSTVFAESGVVLCAVSGAGSIPAWCHVLGMGTIGIGAAPLAMSCGELLGVVDFKKARLAIAGSVMVSGCGFALQYLLGTLSFWLGAVACTVLLTVALLFSLESWRPELTPAKYRTLLTGPGARQSVNMPLRIVSGLVAYGIALGLMLSFCLYTTWSLPNNLLFFAGGVVLAACPLFVINRFTALELDVELLYKLVLPMIAGLLLLSTFFGQDVPSQLIILLAAIVWSYQLVLSITLSSKLAAQLPSPGMLAFCRMAAFHNLGIGGGVCAWTLLYALGSLEGRGMLVVSAIAILLLIIAGAFLLNEPSNVSIWGMIPAEARGTQEIAESETLPEIESLSKRYGLTEREKEVLLLLARGRNAQFIAKQLVISIHTAKTHIKHIYYKADIHTQQELLDTIEQAVSGK